MLFSGYQVVVEVEVFLWGASETYYFNWRRRGDVEANKWREVVDCGLGGERGKEERGGRNGGLINKEICRVVNVAEGGFL